MIILVQCYERATYHGVGVLSVRHTTGSTYRACDIPRGRRTERATHHGVGLRACDTPRGRRTGNKQAAENDGESETFQCGMWTETTA